MYMLVTILTLEYASSESIANYNYFGMFLVLSNLQEMAIIIC